MVLAADPDLTVEDNGAGRIDVGEGANVLIESIMDLRDGSVVLVLRGQVGK